MSITEIGLVLLVACVVAMASRRFNLPYSVGLVAAGAVLGVFGPALHLPLTPELIFTIFLPPLVFEAALQLPWRPFRRDLPATLTFAFLGVPTAAAVVAAGMHYAVGWSWIGSALFGVLIAATDPVSVIATFKELKVEERLKLIVESESLLNDGVAAVAFAVLVGVANGGALAPLPVAGTLLFTVLGGVAVGGAVAGGLLLIAGRTEDHLVEITLTTIAAYGSFLTAEHFHMSGVLASLTAGLVVGNVGWLGAISSGARERVVGFWEYAAFLANSVIFILIGSQEAAQSTRLLTISALVAIGLVLLGRAAAVYPLALLLRATPLKIDARHQHVLMWGGLRGALALALALAVPASVPERSAIIICAFAVVAFSIFVQGLTMLPLLRWLGLILPEREDGETREGAAAATTTPLNT